LRCGAAEGREGERGGRGSERLEDDEGIQDTGGERSGASGSRATMRMALVAKEPTPTYRLFSAGMHMFSGTAYVRHVPGRVVVGGWVGCGEVREAIRIAFQRAYSEVDAVHCESPSALPEHLASRHCFWFRVGPAVADTARARRQMAMRMVVVAVVGCK
jgi:hypothetical protein